MPGTGTGAAVVAGFLPNRLGGSEDRPLLLLLLLPGRYSAGAAASCPPFWGMRKYLGADRMEPAPADGFSAPAGDRAPPENDQGHGDLSGSLPRGHGAPGRGAEPHKLPGLMDEAAMYSGSVLPENTPDPKAYDPAAQAKADSGAADLPHQQQQ